MFPESIITKEGELPGKTLAVFVGIHGNEKVGPFMFERLLQTISIDRGRVYFVYANPPAIEKNVRSVNENLNRLFTRTVVGDEYEFLRAYELMDILDGCDALLDIHSYNSEEGEPFAITSERGYDLASILNVPIIATGFGELGKGTDDYMERQGKIGLCLECGTTNKAHDFVDFAERSVMQFLKYFNAVESDIAFDSVSQRYFVVKSLHTKKTSDFSFSSKFRDFEILPNDKPFLLDGTTSVTANPQEAILFPRDDVPVGGEVCIVGEFLK
jgi:succinylglutamate desuccinylase